MLYPFSTRIRVFKYGHTWYKRAQEPDPQLGWDTDNVPPRMERLRSQDWYMGAYPDECFTCYDPFLQEPALFRNFADLAYDGDIPSKLEDPIGEEKMRAMIKFANSYGIPSNPDIPVPNSSQYRVDTMQIRDAIRLYDAIGKDDTEALSDYVLWDRQSKQWLYSNATVLGFNLTNFDWLLPVAWEKMPNNEGAMLACATKMLDHTIEYTTQMLVKVKPTRRPDGRMTLQLDLDDLVPVMWLQFALAVAEDKKYRRCELCGKQFELSPDVTRSDRRFCADTCRVKSYQRRQAKARKMRAAGAHLREIVKIVGSDSKTIKRWLGEGK